MVVEVEASSDAKAETTGIMAAMGGPGGALETSGGELSVVLAIVVVG